VKVTIVGGGGGVAVSVPASLGPDGVEQIHEWEPAPADLIALRASAEYVRTAVENIEG
jgi:malate/lactate dehydrogenase